VEIIEQHYPQHIDLALESEVLRHLWQKGLQSLQSLQTPLGITASGHNDQFHAIFGRDSLWTVLLALEAASLQQTMKEWGMTPVQGQVPALPEGIACGQGEQEGSRRSVTTFLPDSYTGWLHDLAASVLRGLASLQGKVVNDVNEEQPGRIVHEYWDPVPQRMLAAGWPVINGRYYGSFDATFLYLIALARVDAFFDDQALLEELWPSADATLDWMLEWSDLDQDGLVEYAKRNPEGIGLANQVWKDSGEAIQPHEHLPISHPVAWVEVQGYAWAAYAAYIELAKKRHCLDHSLHRELQHRMEHLLHGLQRFWLGEEQFPAIVLDGKKNPLPAVSSNPGHLLWSGCIERVQAEQICKRLMQPDMLTPWGLRTLSERAYYYNPLKYHCGAVWPFDNAIAASGLQRYGFSSQAHIIAERVLHAMLAFGEPVELYTVQPSRWLRSPRIEQEWFLADYFYACSVQAWTAAAILYLTSMLLGRNRE